MIDFSNYFSLKYLFNVNPRPLTPRDLKIILGFFVLFLAAAIGLRIFVKVKSVEPLVAEILIRLRSLFLFFSLVGLLLLFFRWQEVALLGARFWFFILAIVALFWLFFISRFAWRKVPARRENLKTKEEFNKYLPKKKK